MEPFLRSVGIPRPLSSMRRRMVEAVALRRTMTEVAPEWRAMLVKASWAMRKRWVSVSSQ